MMNAWTTWKGLLLAALVAVFLTACGGDDGGGSSNSAPDFGDNDPNVVVAIGDSITEGRCVPAGAPYPSRVAGLTGKTVINQGKCGELTSGGAARIGGVLSKYKPGYVLILYGANDAIFGYGTDAFIDRLRSVIGAVKANKSVAIVGTVLPMYDSHAYAEGRAADYSSAIRSLAREMNVRLADVRKEFGSERSFLLEDGLHPSDSGNQLLAFTFEDDI